MSDGVPITPGSGTAIATDEVGGVHFQRVKPSFGIDGVATDVSATDPLPVAIISGGGSGGLTNAELRASPVPVSGTVTATGPLTDVQIRATALPVSQSGTWNIGSLTTLPALVAGTALIGKVGIDQTTPGTTNKVSIGTDGTVAINAAVPTGTNRLGTVQLTGGATSQALGLGATCTAYGNLRITAEPTAQFSDPFDGGTIDVTNRWNASVVTGGMTVTQASGGLVITTNTTTGASAYIDSLPTFPPLGLNFNVYGAAVKLEAQTANFFVTNQHRFWGIGNRPASFLIATPLLDAVGFEIDTTGQLQAVVYSNGTRVYNTATSLTGVNLNTLVTPSTGYCRFGIAMRADTIIFYIGTTEYPAATYSVSTASFTLPLVQALPIRTHAINSASTPSGVSTLVVTTLAMGDTGGNSASLTDGTFAWRKATVGATGALSVNSAQINGITPLMGNGVTGTGSQRVTIASDNTAFAVNATLQTGAAVIGALTANQSVNVAQMNGVATTMGNGVAGTGVQRVAIASDNTAFSVNATPATPTASIINSAATTNATSIKASAGTLHSITCSNAGAAAAFVKLYNLAVAPTVGTSVIVLTIPIAASGVVNLTFGATGMRFGTGIALAITNLVGEADATAVAAAQVKVLTSYI